MKKGSLMNQMLSNSKSGAPVVNEGATISLWTDRHAYKVIEVSEDRKECKIQRYAPERVDNLGMSDAQSYKFEKLTDEVKVLKFVYKKWKVIGRKIIFTKQFIKDAEKRELSPIQHLIENHKSDYDRIYDHNISPYPIKVVDGITCERKTYNDVNITFGLLDEYYDFSF